MAFPQVLNAPINRKANVVYPDYPTAYMSFDNHTKILFGNGVIAKFTRNSTAYLSNGTLVNTNLPRYYPGLTYSQNPNDLAIMVEEGTTNLIKNPSASNDLTYWYLNKDANSVASMARITNDGVLGSTCVECTRTTLASSGWIVFQQMLYQYSSSPYFDTTKQYTLSFWAKSIAGSNVLTVTIKDSNGTNIVSNGKAVTLTSDWQRYVITFTPLIAGNQPVLYLTIGADNSTFRITAVQLEQKPYATSFIDATRSPETLTIPTAGVLNPQEGTVECWVYVNNYLKTNYGTTKQIFWWSASTGRISLGWNVGGYWYTVVGNGTNNTFASIQDTLSTGWHLFTIRWNATELALLIDGGAQKATASNPYLPSSVSGSAYIGSGVGSLYTNSLIDDLRISSRARTDSEIATAYASGQPLYLAI